MNDEQRILESLRGLAKHPTATFPAIVINNYPDEEYIDVQDLSGVEYPDVRKRAAIEDKDSGLIITPVTGSSVIVSRLESSDELFIEMFSEIESIRIKKDTTHLLVDQNGYKIERDNENLGKCLSDLIDELNRIVIIYGNDINRGAMNGIKNRIQKILQ